MARPQDIRRRALQALYQLDVRGEDDAPEIRAAMEAEPDGLGPRDVARAMDLALAAHRARTTADGAVRDLAPEWPAHRQPAMDRAILRLAHFEMTSGLVGPAVAINEAVELAKEFSTERSPAFVNAVLDALRKRLEPAPVDAAAPQDSTL